MFVREFILFSVLLLQSSQAAVDGDWAKYDSCKVAGQSPIDINSLQAVRGKSDVEFSWEGSTAIENIMVRSNGEIVFIRTSAKAAFGESVTVDKVKYALESVNFHWGADGEKGSEHQVDGVAYDGEVELIHENQGTGKTVIVSVFLKKDDCTIDSSEISVIRDALDRLSYKAEKKPLHTGGEKVSFASFKTGGEFYRYTGAYTSVPCEADVERIVLKEPLLVSPAFFCKLRNVKSKEGGALLASRIRPLQDLGSRTVYKNF